MRSEPILLCGRASSCTRSSHSSGWHQWVRWLLALLISLVAAGAMAAPTTVTVTQYDSHLAYNTRMSIYVSLTGTIGRADTITFKADNVPFFTAGLNGNNSLMLGGQWSWMTPGSHSLTVTYDQDGSTSVPVPVTVDKVTPTLSLGASPLTVSYGGNVQFNASLSSVLAPTGPVAFVEGSTTLGTAAISGGSAIFNLNTLPIGTHQIKASYDGDSSNEAANSGSVAVQVIRATPALALSLSSSSINYGAAATATATLTGGPLASGFVTFMNGSTVVGRSAVSGGSASLAVPAPGIGSFPISAVYEGDANHAGASSNTATLNVTQAPVSVGLNISPATALYGAPVLLQATVSGATPTGMVTFMEGGVTLGTAALSGGTARFTTLALDVGNHTITAVYGGDTFNRAGTSSNSTVTINKYSPSLALSASASSVTVGAPLTLTATLGGGLAATGTVSFMDGATLLGSATLVNGSATLTLNTLTVGNHAITASYAGDAANQPATAGAVPVAVNRAASTVALNASQSSAAYGTPVTFTATVAGNAPGGTVSFMEGATLLGSATLANGSATLTVSTLTVGNHAITASYAGDAVNQPANASAVAVVIGRAGSALVLTSSVASAAYGTPVTFAAAVAGNAPGGTVSFMEGATLLGSATLASGSATLTVSTLAVGSHAITASYAGDAVNQPASGGAVTVTVNRVAATAALTTSLSSAAYGTPVTLTAAVAGNAPGGTVSFMDGATPLGTVALAGGGASLSTSSLSVGTHRLSVQYSGDGNNAAAVSPSVTISIGKSSPAIALAVSATALNQGVPLNLSATLTGGVAPTGTVSFKDGATTLGTVGLAGGSAALTIATLGVGAHSITALYHGDGNNNALTSTGVTVSVASILPTVASLAPASGPALGNTRVTISGAHLGGAASVLFGGSAARIVSNSENELVVIAPAHAAGAVDVVIAAATGSLTVAAGYTYAALPDPASNAAITGMVRAQTQAVHQFATAHLSNFTQRLESLHRDGGGQSSFGLSFGQTNSVRREPTTWGRNGDIVNYSDSELAYLRQGLRRTGLGSAATTATTAAHAQDENNLPDLPQTADGARRRDMAWWISGALDLANQKGTGGQSGSRLSTSGISFGGDYRFSRTVTAGLGAGYSRSNYRADDASASSIGQGMMGVAYASVRPLEDLYVDLAAGYGVLHFKLSRLIGETGVTGAGSRGGRQAFGSATVGYEWHGENWLLSPFGRVDIARARLDRYTESGGLGALTYFSQTVRNDAAYLGLRGEFSVPLSIGVFTPQGRVAYQRNLQGAGQASMTYADPLLASPVFSFSDSAQENRQWLLTLGGRLLFKSGMALTVLYTHNAANALVTSQSLNVNLSGQF